MRWTGTRTVQDWVEDESTANAASPAEKPKKKRRVRFVSPPPPNAKSGETDVPGRVSAHSSPEVTDKVWVYAEEFGGPLEEERIRRILREHLEVT